MKRKIIIITIISIFLISAGLILYFSSKINKAERNYNDSTTSTSITTKLTAESINEISSTTSTATITTTSQKTTSKKIISTSTSTSTSTSKSTSKQTVPESTTTTKTFSINISDLLKNVKRKKGKVNVYLFYGEGCPHCKLEHEVLDEIKNEYGMYYNLYEFEIWYNKDNYELANVFAGAMNTKLRGVPFTVIGEQTMTGFGSESKEILINKIMEEKDKGYDVYFDKLKER